MGYLFSLGSGVNFVFFVDVINNKCKYLGCVRGFEDGIIFIIKFKLVY